MPVENLPRIYLYRRIVQAKLFIDRNYEESIDAGEIAFQLFNEHYDAMENCYKGFFPELKIFTFTRLQELLNS